MKQLLFSLLADLIMLSSVYAQNTGVDWKELSSDFYSISYPADWQVDKSGQMGTSFFIFSPLSSEQDQFKENINLLIQELPDYHIDLDKYIQASETQIQSVATTDGIKLSDRVAKESGVYHKLIYSTQQGNFLLKVEQYIWVSKGKAYVLTLTCEETQFDRYQPLGERILDSFKLKLL